MLLDLLVGDLVGRHLDGDGAVVGQLDDGRHGAGNGEGEGLAVFRDRVDVEGGLANKEDVCSVQAAKGMAVDDLLCNAAHSSLMAANALLKDVAGRLALAETGDFHLAKLAEVLLDRSVDFLCRGSHGDDDLALLAVLLENLARDLHLFPL